jgi:hypothetical protein
MLGVDLAELFGIQKKVLKQAVRRNIERFPEGFADLRSQIVTSSWESTRYAPYELSKPKIFFRSYPRGRNKQKLAENPS